jgi:hypothetical protein
MVYRFCVSSDARNDDAFEDSENSLAYAVYLLERDSEAALLLLNSLLPVMVEAWYAQQGVYPPARDQMLRDLAEREPDIAASLRQALRAPDARARMRSAQHLLAVLRGQADAAAN